MGCIALPPSWHGFGSLRGGIGAKRGAAPGPVVWSDSDPAVLILIRKMFGYGAGLNI